MSIVQALRSAASGMSARQWAMDVTADNIANVSTPGFKGSSPRFTDLLYGVEPGSSGEVAVGRGVRMSETRKDFSMGVLENDGERYHLAIEGEGFFQVRLPDGGLGYTRAGVIGVDGEGWITVGGGYLLEPPLRVPEGSSDLTVSSDGRVTVTSGEGEEVELGYIVLARFINPGGLLARGDGILSASEASGPPRTALPGGEGMGLLRQGFLERSNVDLAREMTALITSLRVYQLNARMVQVADQALGEANNIVRG